MNTGAKTRITEIETNEFLTNPFYQVYEKYIDEAFTPTLDFPDSVVGQIYTANRLNATISSSDNTITRLPNELQNFIQQKLTENIHIIPQVGIELLDLIINYKNNKLGYIIGSVGVGKSTFIHHTLCSIPNECPSLKRLFTPIIFDFLKTSYKPTLFDIAELMRREFLSSENNLPKETRSFFGNNETWLCKSKNPEIPCHFSDLLSCTEQIAEKISPSELVLVFDNVDQLSPEAVILIVDLGRAIAARLNGHNNNLATVLIAMRPPTLRTELEKNFGKSSYATYIYHITPPDLREVICKRLNLSLTSYEKNERQSIGSGTMTVYLAPVEETFRIISDKILDPEQQRFIYKLCNNSVRKALLAFVYFLKYKNLDLKLIFPTVSHNNENAFGSSDFKNFDWKEHLLDGLMLGPYQFYSDQGNASYIYNIYSFKSKTNGEQYTLLYNLLCFLNWRQQITTVQEIVSVMTMLGYDTLLIQDALSHCLVRGLIYSPESIFPEISNFLQDINHLSISETGKFYIELLIEYPQYLYQVIYDVGLTYDQSHSQYLNQKDGYLRKDFVLRITLIYTLAKTLLEIEEEQVNILKKHTEYEQPAREAIACLRSHGFLLRRLSNGVRPLICGGKNSKRETIKTSAEQFEQDFDQLDKKLIKMEESLEKEILGFAENIAFSISKTETHKVTIQKHGFSEIKLPRLLDPAGRNMAKFSLTLRNASYVRSPICLLHSLDDSFPHEIFIPLVEKSHGHYEADKSLPAPNETRKCPPFSVTLIDGTQPLTVFSIGT